MVSMFFVCLGRQVTKSIRGKNFGQVTLSQVTLSQETIYQLSVVLHCLRTESPNIFKELRTLDCAIIHITTDDLSKSEQRSDVLKEKYKALNQSRHLEIRSLGVVDLTTRT